MTSTLQPIDFPAPLVNPSAAGLFSATNWLSDGEPLRWLPSGVAFRVFNYGGTSSFGVWTAPWDAVTSDLEEGDIKTGVRPDFPDAFVAMTTYGYDQGNLMQWSQDEVDTRAQQVQRLQEPNAVETTFAARLLDDAGTPDSVPDIVDAVSDLEGLLAETGTFGVIHASAAIAAQAAKWNLIIRSGAQLKTPLGHTWAFGGGYVAALGATLVATSPPYGWRGPVESRGAVTTKFNQYAAIAERSLVIGYEAVIGAATIS